MKDSAEATKEVVVMVVMEDVVEEEEVVDKVSDSQGPNTDRSIKKVTILRQLGHQKVSSHKRDSVYKSNEVNLFSFGSHE